jgi:hypothetical protein
MLDLAERTQDPALIQRKMDMLSRMPPAEAAALRERITENMRKLSSVSDSVAPGASMSVEQALVAAQRDRQAFFDSLVAQRKDMTQAEIEAISERLGPQNLDMLNDELRGALLANMEMSATQRQQILESLGLRAGTGPEGLPLSTREGGKSLFPAVDIEKQAEALINKYQIERPSLRTPLPAPIQLLSNFVRTQKAAREKIESQLTKSLVDQVFDAELFGTGRTFDPELIKVAKNSARQLVGAATERVEGMKRQKGLSMKDLAELRMGRGKGADAEGNVEIAITPGTSIRINPKKILEDAKAGAEEQTAINLNLPEALDYIQAAIRFRSDALARSRTLDSQRILDTSKAVYDDIEKLVLNSVVDQEQYDVLKGTMDSYRKSFEKRLPLLSTRVTRQGALKQDEYLLPNEDLMKRAFSNAENLRQLKAALQDTPEGVSLIERGAMDWLRSQNVVDKNGLVDPRKMQQVLDRNQNIVDELPANIQQRFQNEVTLAENYISRLGQLDQRKVLAQDNELDSILARGARPDADIKSTLALALEDPAKMRKLVDEFGKNPDHLAALRRGVYDLATEGGKQGGLLKSFLDKNEKSLSVLFRDTEHMKSLKALADIQQRITTFAAATGQVPRFETSNEALQRLFGAGVGWITTSARDARGGFTRPTTVGIAMGVRMASSLETRLYDRIFTRALEDPKFAAAVTKISTPEGAARAAAELSKIGIPPSAYVPRAVVGLKAEAVDAANEAARKPQPPVSKPVPSAKQMLRALPPAPPTRGTSYEHTPRLGPLPELPQQGPQTNLLYPALFPNDPISAMLQARTQPGQNPVMPPPGK